MEYNTINGGENMKMFGERLRELRLENKMTGEELGKAFNVTKTAISYWENGKSFPDEITLKKFADYFLVDLGYLLGKSNKRTYKVDKELPDAIAELGVDYYTVTKEAKEKGLSAEDLKRIIDAVILIKKE